MFAAGRVPPSSLTHWMRGTVARLLRDQSGVSAALVAIALPGLMGCAALGVETGIWFAIKLQNQSAADAAAISAAHEVIAGKSIDELVAAATEAAAQNGFRGSAPTVVYPYDDGSVSNAVAVTLEQREGALLAAMFISAVTVATKAVAVIEVLDNPCLLAFATSGTGVEIADAARLDASNCAVAANSTSQSAVDLHSTTSAIAAATIVTQGQVSLQGSPINPAAPPPEFALASPVRIGAPSVADPYAGVLTHTSLIAGIPTITNRCKSKNSGQVQVYDGNCTVDATTLKQPQIRLSAGTQISGSWTIASGRSVDLSPGTYWLTDGDLIIEPSGVLKCSTCDNITGTGITLILTTQSSKIGTLSIEPSATVNLNAPIAGRFPGVVLVQDANGLPSGTSYTSTYSTITGTSGATLNGLVYFPKSSMTFWGNPSPTGPRCLLLVVNAAMVEGASSLETAGCPGAGLANLPKIYTAALAE
jgi:hypothetical protein